MIFTNLVGPFIPYIFPGNSYSKSMFGFVPAIGDIGTGFSCISHNGIVKFGIIADSARIENPRVFLDIYEQILVQLLDGRI